MMILTTSVPCNRNKSFLAYAIPNRFSPRNAYMKEKVIQFKSNNSNQPNVGNPYPILAMSRPDRDGFSQARLLATRRYQATKQDSKVNECNRKVIGVVYLR